jgi:hypothetical protein
MFDRDFDVVKRVLCRRLSLLSLLQVSGCSGAEPRIFFVSTAVLQRHPT